MGKTPVILRFAALAVVIAFGVGMVGFWLLRFESGDIYRPYSSMRSDPLGTRAFYESLEQLPEITVRRNYKSLKKLTAPDGGTLFYLGIDRDAMPSELAMGTSGPSEFGGGSARAIHNFISNGGRVVVSFSPLAGASRIDALEVLFGDREDESEDDEEESTDNDGKSTDDKEESTDDDGKSTDDKEESTNDEKEKTEPSEPEDTETEDHTYDSLGSTLGLSMDYEDDASWQQVHDTPAEGSDEISAGWPGIAWHGRMYFKDLSNEWTVIYRRADKPVIIERAIDSGSIVICTDTYFLSNEAMIDRNSRNPQLLAWLVNKPTVVFDETHLGVVSGEGISSLAEEHGLANLFFVLLVIAGLYLWKSSVSFLPRDPEHIERFGGHGISGKSSAAGLHNLLRKCIPVSRILNECLKHWSASISTSRPKQRAARDKIRAVIDAENNRSTRQQDPVKAYTTICRILAERKL
jgi:hypothetical protein